MGFDEGSELPLVDLHKKTTKVNAAMIAGVLIFFLATAVMVLWLHHDPNPTVNRMHEQRVPVSTPVPAETGRRND